MQKTLRRSGQAAGVAWSFATAVVSLPWGLQIRRKENFSNGYFLHFRRTILKNSGMERSKMPEPIDDTSTNFLVLEDNQNIRSLYKILIGQKYSGALTTYAENGKEGLEACKKSEPSLILADIKMPLMDGIEFHRNLKKTAPHLADRVAFISATFSNLHLDYMRDNNCRYLEKPFETNAFHQFIYSLLVTESDQGLSIRSKA